MLGPFGDPGGDEIGTRLKQSVTPPSPFRPDRPKLPWPLFTSHKTALKPFSIFLTSLRATTPGNLVPTYSVSNVHYSILVRQNTSADVSHRAPEQAVRPRWLQAAATSQVQALSATGHQLVAELCF